VVYRIGDEVEFKKSGGRRRRSRWVPVEVCDVHQGGMYGELTYSVWLFESRRMVEFVRSDELRFKYHADMERRIRDDELVRRREDRRRMTLKLARQQRDGGFARGRRMDTYGGGRGRSQRAARTWHPRSHSVDGNVLIPVRQDRQQERATSVPPDNTSWPAFFAEFAKAYNDRRGDYVNGDEQQLKDVDGDAATYSRVVRHNHGNRIHESERDHWGKRGTYRVTDMSRVADIVDDRSEFNVNGVERTPPANDNYMGGRRGPYDIRDVKNRLGNGGDINLNFVLPSCKVQQDENT